MAIFYWLVTNSGYVFAENNVNMDVGKVKLHTEFNGNDGLIKSENEMTVNYITDDFYNVLFTDLKKDQLIDVPVGKYKVDYISFIGSYELQLKLKAPKEFEIEKDKITNLDFEVVKDPTQTPNAIAERAKEMEEKYAAKKKNDHNVIVSNKNKARSNTSKNNDIADNKNPNQKFKFNIDYLAIILLIGLVIALIVLKRKSGIKVK